MTVALRPRAVPAMPALGSRPTAEVVGLAWLEQRAAAWDRLVEAQADPNPYWSRHVVAAHAAHGVAARGMRFLAVHRGGALLALLPFQPDDARIGLWRRAHRGWTSPYTVNGTPLVAEEDRAAALEALLDALPGVPGRARFWILPLVCLDHPVGRAVASAIGRRGWPVETVSTFERAVLDRRADYDTYAATCLGPGRRKALRRQHGKLAALGRLAFDSVSGGEDLSRAVEQFLALEAAGWKGRRGTALASRPQTAALARQLFASGEGPVACRADRLSLDGRPIAVSLALVCGGTAHLLKTAYDESLRKLSPGVALENEIIRTCHETGFARRLDTASLPGGVLDDLYPDRGRIGDLLFACDAGVSAAALRTVAEQDRRCREGLKQLKAFYWRMREARRRGSPPAPEA